MQGSNCDTTKIVLKSIKDNKGRVAFKIKDSWDSLEDKNEVRLFNDSCYSRYTELITLFGELSYKKVSKKFRENNIELHYPLDPQRIKNGVGNLEKQRFTVAVKGTCEDFDRFKELFTSTPESITNNKLATYVPFDRNNDGVFGEEDQIDINISGPINGAVEVIKVITNDELNSFEVYFQALKGHPDAGNIRFSGKYVEDYCDYSDDSFVEFEIFNITRINFPLDEAFPFAERLVSRTSRTNQKSQWKNVLANFCNFLEKDTFFAEMCIDEFEWDTNTEYIGKFIENKTENITNDVNKCRTEPNGFKLH